MSLMHKNLNPTLYLFTMSTNYLVSIFFFFFFFFFFENELFSKLSDLFKQYISLFFFLSSKNIMKRSCKLLTVTNRPNPHRFFFLFLSLTFLHFQKLLGHSSIFNIYKTSNFPPWPIMHNMLSWFV